jgi:hypothetical protein
MGSVASLRTTRAHGGSITAMLQTRTSLLAVVVAVALAACGVPPSVECVQYVACQEAYDTAFDILPDSGGVETSAYEVGGDCWADLQTSQTCTDNCTRAIESLRNAANEGGESLEECVPQ